VSSEGQGQGQDKKPERLLLKGKVYVNISNIMSKFFRRKCTTQMQATSTTKNQVQDGKYKKYNTIDDRYQTFSLRQVMTM